jgi:protein gp37
VFVNEFSDLLHNALPLKVILEHIRVFDTAGWHQFQVLTKRSKRLAEVNSAVLAEFGSWPTNIWMGVSVCSVAKAEMQRIDNLGVTDAAVRWISFEPWVSDPKRPLRQAKPNLRKVFRKNKIAWTVIGGQSGSRNNSDLMTLDDARYLIEESTAAGCKVHFKQLGTALAIQLGVYGKRGNSEHRDKGGSPDQWPPDLNLREWPEVTWKPVSNVSGFRPAYVPTKWKLFKKTA